MLGLVVGTLTVAASPAWDVPVEDLSVDELRMRSFTKILDGRRNA